MKLKMNMKKNTVHWQMLPQRLAKMKAKRTVRRRNRQLRLLWLRPSYQALALNDKECFERSLRHRRQIRRHLRNRHLYARIQKLW